MARRTPADYSPEETRLILGDDSTWPEGTWSVAFEDGSLTEDDELADAAALDETGRAENMPPPPPAAAKPPNARDGGMWARFVRWMQRHGG